LKYEFVPSAIQLLKRLFAIVCGYLHNFMHPAPIQTNIWRKYWKLLDF